MIERETETEREIDERERTLNTEHFIDRPQTHINGG